MPIIDLRSTLFRLMIEEYLGLEPNFDELDCICTIKDYEIKRFSLLLQIMCSPSACPISAAVDIAFEYCGQKVRSFLISFKNVFRLMYVFIRRRMPPLLPYLLAIVIVVPS